MLLPLAVLFAGAMALIGWNIGRGKTDPLKFKGVVAGAGAPPGMTWNPYTRNWERSRRPPPGFEGYGGGGAPPQGSALAYLSQLLSAGGFPPMPLLEAAYAEAQRVSDYTSMRLIEQMAMGNFSGQLQPLPPPGQPQAPPQPGTQGVPGVPFVGKEGDVVDLQFDEQGNPILDDYEVANPETIQEDLASCPIDADPASWHKFCEALRTKKAAWQSGQYLGAFEHNRHRLKQLGLEPAPGDEKAQYAALCADIANYNQECAKLIESYAGTPIDLDDGKLTPITRSGVLGLLKAAGPKGAESWLRNKRDRLKFPQTTETFKRTNGCF